MCMWLTHLQYKVVFQLIFKVKVHVWVVQASHNVWIPIGLWTWREGRWRERERERRPQYVHVHVHVYVECSLSNPDTLGGVLISGVEFMAFGTAKYRCVLITVLHDVYLPVTGSTLLISPSTATSDPNTSPGRLRDDWTAGDIQCRGESNDLCSAIHSHMYSTCNRQVPLGTTTN